VPRRWGGSRVGHSQALALVVDIASQRGAAKFTEAAASVYCPDQLSADSDGGNGNGGAK
jgi:hypothetical protein